MFIKNNSNVNIWRGIIATFFSRNRGAPAQAHKFSSAERKSCSKVLLRWAELFEQLLSKELNWSDSSRSWAELFEQLLSKELIWFRPQKTLLVAFLIWCQSVQFRSESCSISSALLKGAVRKVQLMSESCLISSAPERERFQQLLRSELELNCYTPIIDRIS